MDSERLVELILWVLSLVLALVFIYNGMAKIMGTMIQVTLFESLGLPAEIRRLVGVLECLGGVMLILPRIALAGGLLLAAIMVASAGLHLAHGNIGPFFRAIVMVLMLVSICYLRYKRRPAQP